VHTPVFSNQTPVYLAFVQQIPSIYVISLAYALNTRHRIRRSNSTLKGSGISVTVETSDDGTRAPRVVSMSMPPQTLDLSGKTYHNSQSDSESESADSLA